MITVTPIIPPPLPSPTTTVNSITRDLEETLLFSTPPVGSYTVHKFCLNSRFCCCLFLIKECLSYPIVIVQTNYPYEGSCTPCTVHTKKSLFFVIFPFKGFLILSYCLSKYNFCGPCLVLLIIIK